MAHDGLTPASVLLQRLPAGDHRVRVMDFGLAGLDAASRAQGTIPGRWECLAPEQEGGAAGVAPAESKVLPRPRS